MFVSKNLNFIPGNKSFLGMLFCS